MHFPVETLLVKQRLLFYRLVFFYDQDYSASEGTLFFCMFFCSQITIKSTDLLFTASYSYINITPKVILNAAVCKRVFFHTAFNFIGDWGSGSAGLKDTGASFVT